MPTTFQEFESTCNSVGYSQTEILFFAKAHGHKDPESFDACSLCSDLYEGNNEILLTVLLDYWHGEPSTDLIKYLWTAADGHVDIWSSAYYRFKANLGLYSNSPIEILADSARNLLCWFSNERVQEHGEFEPYFAKLVKHPLCNDQIVNDFKDRMHELFYNECDCSHPETCLLCQGMHP